MKKVAFHNLGCKVNSYEVEVMQQIMEEKGYEIVPFDEKADIYIINTCTVTNIADRKSRQMLHRAKQKNPDAVVVAVGCYVQTGKEAVNQDDSIDLAVGNNRKKDLVTIVEKYLADREKGNPVVKDENVPDINNTFEYEEMTLTHTAEHTRAYIKIQDGCNQFCTYCVIPYARGRVRSRREEDIINEIKGLVAAGYKEIVITGIHISSYGIDIDNGERRDYSGKSKVIDLIEKINSIEGLERIRLGSFESRIITEENAERLSKLDKVCPHFHLSLQSGCDDTLKRMNRRYDTAMYAESVGYLRKYFEDVAITTDVIVGFPGETEAEFQETVEFLEKIKFYEMHIFKYSKRAGTKAAVMPNQVPDTIKTERSNVLLDMEKKQSKCFRESCIGKKIEVLFEEKKEIGSRAYMIGHTENYIKVAVPMGKDCSESELTNRICNVYAEGFLQDDIVLGKVM